jgi:hypothetical protein
VHGAVPAGAPMNSTFSDRRPGPCRASRTAGDRSAGRAGGVKILAGATASTAAASWTSRNLNSHAGSRRKPRSVWKTPVPRRTVATVSRTVTGGPFPAADLNALNAWRALISG